MNTSPNRPYTIAVSLLGLFLLVVAGALPAVAQRPVSDDEVNAIAKKLYCPVCESTPLDVCPTQACADWREVIRTKLGEGQTEEEIRDYFETQYGARALSEPPRQGFTLAVWILPIAAIVIGAFVFSRYLRRIRTEAGAPAGVDGPAPVETPLEEGVMPRDDYEARIERELREM
jgi:cytochrome c-type biogenesis protein CcmH